MEFMQRFIGKSCATNVTVLGQLNHAWPWNLGHCSSACSCDLGVNCMSLHDNHCNVVHGDLLSLNLLFGVI